MKKRGSLYMMGREKNLHKMLRRNFLYIFKKRRMMKIRSNNFIVAGLQLYRNIRLTSHVATIPSIQKKFALVF